MRYLATLRLTRVGMSTLAAVVLACAAPAAHAQGGRPPAAFVGAVLTGGGVAPFGESFVGPGGGEISGDEALTQVILPGGTIKNLRVLLRPVPGFVPPLQNVAVFQVMVNGDATTLTCTLPAFGVCVGPLQVTIEENALVTLRVVNSLFHNNPPVPLPFILVTYSFELE